MRDYSIVHPSFWSSVTIRSLSEDARTLALYLLTSPHNTISGIYRLPDMYAAEDLKWKTERVSKGFSELFQNGFCNRCETTNWVFIHKFLKWNCPQNPNQIKAIQKIIVSIPDECSWRLDFIGRFSEFAKKKDTNIWNRSETVSKLFLNQEQDQDQEYEQDQDQERESGIEKSEPSCFDEFWSSYPDNCPRKVRKAEAEKKWKLDKLDKKFLEIMEGLERWKLSQQWADDDGKYIVAPVVFLNKKLYQDTPKVAKHQHKGGERLNKNISAAQEWLEEKTAMGGEYDAE